MKNFILLITVLFTFYSCNKDAVQNMGPFKGVDDIDNIVILGDNAKFAAYNVKTKQVQEVYELEKSFATEFGYAAGHLLITVQGGGRFNINISTGEVSKHTMPYDAKYYLDVENHKNIIEATGKEGYCTYRYNVVSNKMDKIFEHPMRRTLSSYAMEQNDTIYWFPETYFRNKNSKYIINSFKNVFLVGNKDTNQSFVYRKNNFINRIVYKPNSSYAKIIVEKIINLIPLKTIPFFYCPENIGGGISRTLLYKDNVLLFVTSQLYLVDSLGKALFRWGDYEEERSHSTDYKSLYSRISKKIYKDKLYVFGQRYNSKKNETRSCCVEINLITGEDKWIEVWEGL